MDGKYVFDIKSWPYTSNKTTDYADKKAAEWSNGTKTEIRQIEMTGKL